MKLRVVLCAALLSGNAAAFIPECSLTGYVTAFPTHPTPRDPVSYEVSLAPLRLYYDPYIGYTRISVQPGTPIGKVSIDLVISRDPLDMPGYTAAPLRFSRVLGPFDALPAGNYDVTATVSLVEKGTGTVDITAQCLNRPELLLVVGEPGDPVRTAPVVEFYNASLDHYFITQNTAEIAKLDASGDWKRTGQSFIAYLPDAGDGRGQPVARYYGLPSAGLDSHFYTWNWWEFWKMGELNATKGNGWLFESAAAFSVEWPSTDGICRTGLLPVYRLWNGRVDSAHRYTTDIATKQAMIAKGYVPEGYGPDAVFMCALSQ